MKQLAKSPIEEKLIDLKKIIQENTGILEDDESFERIISLWHETYDELKDAVFDRRNRDARIDFENGWAAQSIQFVIDCLPEFHRIMQQYHKRNDDLTLLDVGAGTGAGSNVFTMLHSGRHVYSKVTVEAVDYTDSRVKWVKTMYPRVKYKVADVYDLPDNNWDMVFCSHVIEHVPDPRKFLEKLVDISKGFLFVYAPYNEINRIPAHINTITESLFEGLNIEKISIFKSMAWHADIPDDMCILAVIDCRKKARKKFKGVEWVMDKFQLLFALATFYGQHLLLEHTGYENSVFLNLTTSPTERQYLLMFSALRDMTAAGGRAHGPSLPVNWLSTSVEKGVYSSYTVTIQVQIYSKQKKSA